MKDPNYLIKVEKAIAEKYGEATIKNPKASWDPEKEKDYLQQLKQLETTKDSEDPEEKIEVNGVLIPKKLITKESDRICLSCRVYSFTRKDDLYMTKFKCCFKCYVQHIEGRENKWLSKLTEQDLKK